MSPIIHFPGFDVGVRTDFAFAPNLTSFGLELCEGLPLLERQFESQVLSCQSGY